SRNYPMLQKSVQMLWNWHLKQSNRGACAFELVFAARLSQCRCQLCGSVPGCAIRPSSRMEIVLTRSRYPHFFFPIFFVFAGLLRLLARAFARAAARFFRHLSHLQPRRVMTLIK